MNHVSLFKGRKQVLCNYIFSEKKQILHNFSHSIFTRKKKQDQNLYLVFLFATEDSLKKMNLVTLILQNFVMLWEEFYKICMDIYFHRQNAIFFFINYFKKFYKFIILSLWKCISGNIFSLIQNHNNVFTPSPPEKNREKNTSIYY